MNEQERKAQYVHYVTETARPYIAETSHLFDTWLDGSEHWDYARNDRLLWLTEKLKDLVECNPHDIKGGIGGKFRREDRLAYVESTEVAWFSTTKDRLLSIAIQRDGSIMLIRFVGTAESRKGQFVLRMSAEDMEDALSDQLEFAARHAAGNLTDEDRERIREQEAYLAQSRPVRRVRRFIMRLIARILRV